MTISRRKFLQHAGIAAFAAGAGVMAQPSVAAAIDGAKPDAKRIAFENLHTGEDLDVEFFGDQGYVATAMSSIETVLRDFRTGGLHPIDPRLMDYLHHVAHSFGMYPRFQVISGYRSPQTNAMLHARSSGVASHSLHMQGRAIDIRFADVDCAVLAERARGLRRGGVGYYRASNFVHLDTGSLRSWHG